MNEEKFKLPGSSYDEIAKIIKSYGHVEKPVELGEISKLAVMDPTSISRNTAFLVAIGILEGGKLKKISPRGLTLARALEHEMPDEIRKNWLDIARENDFLQKIVSAVRIRKGMETSTLRAHIAYSAGQKKNPTVMAGAGAVIDILVAAGLVRDDDGKLIAAIEPTIHVTDKIVIEDEVELRKMAKREPGVNPTAS